MAAALTRDSVRKAPHDPLAPQTFVAQVVWVRRFLSDVSVGAILGEAQAQMTHESFDVVLSDGAYKSKFLLAPALNKLAMQGELSANRVVRVTNFTRRFDERSLSSAAVLIVNGLELLDQQTQLLLRKKKEPLKWADVMENEWVPSAGCRGSYISLLADDFPANDPSWSPNREALQLDAEATAEILGEKTTLLSLSNHFKHLAMFPPVIGRVVAKSQVSFFANIGDSRPFPCQAYFVIDDGTAEVPVVLWYSTCRDFFQSIRPGDVVALRGYRVRSITTFSSAFAPNARIELSINSRNPEGKVHFLLRDSVAELLAEPFQHNIPTMSLKDTRSATDGTVCNIVARILHVGRREVDLFGRTYYLYRWVWLRDESTARPVLAKLYSCSQEMELTNLTAGRLLSCTNLKCRVLVSTSRVPPFFFLRSTKVSQYISAPVSPLSLDELPPSPRASAVCAWALHSVESLDFQVNGVIPFPPLRFRLLPPVQEPVPLAMVSQLLKEMRHCERRQVVVQGYLNKVLLRAPGSSVEDIEWVSQLDLLGALELDQSRPKRRRNKKAAAAKKAIEFHEGMGIFDSNGGNADVTSPLLSTSLEFAAPQVVGDPAGSQAGEAPGEEETVQPAQWCVYIIGLNYDGTVEALVPRGGAESVPALLREFCPEVLKDHNNGVPHEFRTDEGDEVLRMAEVLTKMMSIRMAFVLDLFRHGESTEVSVNRWCTPSYMDRS